MKKKKIIGGLLFLVLLYLLFTIPIVEPHGTDGHGYLPHTPSSLTPRDQSFFAGTRPATANYAGRLVEHPPICHSPQAADGTCTQFCMAGEADSTTWHRDGGGNGGCQLYAFGQTDHDYCSDHTDSNGVTALNACPVACGACVNPSTASSGTIIVVCDASQTDSTTWNAGYGACSTYAETGDNHNFCSGDQGRLCGAGCTAGDSQERVLASVACPVACGECVPASTHSPQAAGTTIVVCDASQTDSASWEGYGGGCDSYVSGLHNHQFCSTDRDLATNQFAYDGCPVACGTCVPASTATTNTAAPVPLISATGGATVPLISAAGGATGAAATSVATALSSSGQPLGTMAGEFLEDILR